MDEQTELTTEIVEGSGNEIAASTTSDTVIARATPRPTREVLVPLDADSVIEGMRAYQNLLPKLLDESDYQGTGSDRFVKKSGWRKIARAFNLSVEIVSISILRDEKGKPSRAECVARAIAPNGQIQDADGYCSIDEFTGRRAKDTKLENTLRATATTRAKNRAISDLVGMGEVSAEEVTADAGGPPYGPATDEENRIAATAALSFLLGDDAEAVWDQIRSDAGGYFPAIVATSIRRVARRLAEQAKAKAGAEVEADEGPTDDVEPPEEEAPAAETDPFTYEPETGE